MRITHLALASLVSLAALTAQNQALQTTTGASPIIDVPFDPLLVPPTGLTVEAWVTYDETTVPTGGIFYWPTVARQNIAPNGESWLFRVGASNFSNRSFEFSVRTATSGLAVLSWAFQPGELLTWTHMAGTFDGTTMRIFKNGVQVATRTTALSEVQNLGGVLRIGNGDVSVPGNETWNGQIDELRIWPMARSAGEITATMNQQLSSMPGKVLTFNLDGIVVDSSRGLVANATGPYAFSAGAPGLVPVTPLAFNVGQSTTTCARSIDAQLGSLPTVGNAAFTVWATRGPRPTSSPLGLVVAAGQGAAAGQPTFQGVTLAFNPATVLAQTTLIPPTSVLGNAAFNLPIPNQPTLLGTSLIFQFGFVDAQCGPQGYSASNGIVFSVQ